MQNGLLDRIVLTKKISEMGADDCRVALGEIDHWQEPLSIWERLEAQRLLEDDAP